MAESNVPDEAGNGRPVFAENSLRTLKQLIAEGRVGNRWYKVNLHAHGERNDPQRVVDEARRAEIDLLAITDHQTFKYCDAIIEASRMQGRALKVLPGIEITAHEGVHIIAIFAESFCGDARTQFMGFLEIPGTGSTTIASKRNADEIFDKVHDLGGIIVIPHPKTQGIGLLDSARKISTKEDWLESGHIRLMQIHEEDVRFLGHDEDGNWVNRFVLGTAQKRHTESSSYCLAPFNRSDAHKPEEIGDGCSWFRMQELSVEGLKQVACEPRTRISRVAPPELRHDHILGVRVGGGYCDGQFFRFNDGLNCLVGDNHSGKSAVLDFLRFGLSQEDQAPKDSRQRLFGRLNGILGDGGVVEVYLRQNGRHFVVKRTFRPETVHQKNEIVIERCTDGSLVYGFDEEQGLVPAQDFRFPLEVYEQGRIGRLREDVERQLDMLDEFAELGHDKGKRDEIISALNVSAIALKPLHDERDSLTAHVARLAEIEQELGEKEKLLPNTEDEQRWSDATAIVGAIELVCQALSESVRILPDPTRMKSGAPNELERLFAQRLPSVDSERIAERDTVLKWFGALKNALTAIAAAREAINTRC